MAGCALHPLTCWDQNQGFPLAKRARYIATGTHGLPNAIRTLWRLWSVRADVIAKAPNPCWFATARSRRFHVL
eukprot:2384777-Amphidinium_carterae.1